MQDKLGKLQKELIETQLTMYLLIQAMAIIIYISMVNFKNMGYVSLSVGIWVIVIIPFITFFSIKQFDIHDKKEKKTLDEVYETTIVYRNPYVHHKNEVHGTTTAYENPYTCYNKIIKDTNLVEFLAIRWTMGLVVYVAICAVAYILAIISKSLIM